MTEDDFVAELRALVMRYEGAGVPNVPENALGFAVAYAVSTAGVSVSEIREKCGALASMAHRVVSAREAGTIGSA